MTDPTHLEFRLRKYYRNLGAVGLTIVTSMGAMSLVAFLRDGEFLRAFFIGAIWAFFTWLYAWLLLAYRRESLVIKDRVITQTGVVRKKCMKVDEILDVRWQSIGSIVLRSATQKIKIYLDNFTRDERQPLIEYLRRAIPYSNQQGWDRFCYQRAVSSVDHSPDQPLREGYLLRTRWHFDRLFIPIVLFALAAGVGFAWYLQQPRWLLTPVAIAGLWLAFRRSIPAKGLVVRKQTDFDKRFLWGLLLWAALGIGVACLLPVAWALIWMVLWIVVLMFISQRTERQKWQRLEGEIQQAVDRWEQEQGVCKPTTPLESPAE